MLLFLKTLFLIHLFSFILDNGHVDFQKLRAQSELWTQERESHVLDLKMAEYYQFKRYKSFAGWYEAKNKFKGVRIYDTIINWSENKDHFDISLESNEIPPFDVFYIDHRGHIKYVVLVSQGKVVYSEKTRPAFLKGKDIRALESIIKLNPDLIFQSIKFAFCYFYIKDGIVYLYDFLNNENKPLLDYDSKRIDELYYESMRMIDPMFE